MAAAGEGGPQDATMAAKYYIHAAQCRNQYFSEPRLLSDPMTVDLEVRIEVQRLLTLHFGYCGRLDGALDNVDTQRLLASLADQRPEGELMPSLEGRPDR
jgi:hypothetical protein